MAAAKNSDSRARQLSTATPSRAPRSATADAPRKDSDGTALTRQDRLRMIQDEFRQEALPQVPEIPGYHLCWLSTTSSYDPIAKRMRLGYTPVDHSELPGFNAERAASGAFTGAISCNEMLLFKIPLDTYEMIMQEFHHDQPLREEEALKQNLRKGERDSGGKELDGEVEGFDDIAVKRPAPTHYA